MALTNCIRRPEVHESDFEGEEISPTPAGPSKKK